MLVADRDTNSFLPNVDFLMRCALFVRHYLIHLSLLLFQKANRLTRNKNVDTTKEVWPCRSEESIYVDPLCGYIFFPVVISTWTARDLY